MVITSCFLVKNYLFNSLFAKTTLYGLILLLNQHGKITENRLVFAEVPITEYIIVIIFYNINGNGNVFKR